VQAAPVETDSQLQEEKRGMAEAAEVEKKGFFPHSYRAEKKFPQGMAAELLRWRRKGHFGGRPVWL